MSDLPARKILIAFALWVVLPAALIALAFVFKAGLIAICVYALFLLLATASLMTRFWMRPVKCAREVSEEVVHIGDRINVGVKITNTARWPILWLYVQETLPGAMPCDGTTRRLLFLPPKRSFHLHYSIIVTRRGCHQIGPLVLESGDVFGLFKKCRVDPVRSFVTAVPDYQIIEEFHVGQRRNLGDYTARRSVFDDPTRIRGVRDYQRGDPLKRIHWKHSARTGHLFSKIYDPVMEAGATVVLDFHRDSWRTKILPDEAQIPPEIAIQIVCTICRYLSDGGWKVGFFSNGRDPLGLPGITIAQARATDSLRDAVHVARRRRRDNRLQPIVIRARRGPEQFAVIHENLGRIELSDGLPIEDLIMEELAYIEREQVLLFVTSRVTEEFIVGVLRVRELGYRIMVFVVASGESHDRAFQAFIPHGIEVFDMDANWRLKEIATGRQFI